ncbi:MAG: Holliday junction branch migration protein RuvA [Clostridia bacterium]|nr:Holliday junction branch migration protein RuvA [Clostridia bacterium]MBR3486955.1 Holliday junction branch migration protein RuvA [Clostridia bacterium]
MYAHIRGTVCSIMPDRVVIEAAGVGYELFCSSLTINRLREGDTAKLLTHFHLSQDAVALYGFNTESEREMFRKLIGITRIGPKVALNVLSVLTPEDVALAVVTENAAAFSRVQGLGKKTAARLILELKEKVDAADGIPSVSVSEASAPIRSEAIAALVSLGYDGALAGRVVSELPECDTVEEMIKQALRELSRK